jgi:TonB-linked SusC/RagA family outer membrane protein
MKISLVISFFCSFGVIANSYSQKESLSMNIEKTPVKEVFKLIEDQTDYRFFYNDELSDIDREVNLVVKDSGIRDILDQLFTNTGVSYTILENNLVVIAPKRSLQQIKVSGIVSDVTTGEPLPGAYVILEGTTTGVVSDANGKFTMEIPDGNVVLVISSVGYLTEKIAVEGRSAIDITLSPDIKKLDEVIVIGYGTVKKSDLTGSVASVSSSDIQKQPITNLAQALQGSASGVTVLSNSGQPGSNIKVRIRGSNTINASSEPLYIVDGVPLNNNPQANAGVGLNNLNVNDIESVEVLKDASSTAIFGSRGANGVVMITTKRGMNEAPKLQFTSNIGISTLPKKYDLLDAGSFAELVNVYKPGYFTAEQINNYKQNEGVDWQDEVYQTGITQDYQLSVAGGNKAGTYYISGNYVDQTGIVVNSHLSKYALRTNISTSVGKKVNVDFNLFAVRVKSNSVNVRYNTNGTADNGYKGSPLFNAVLFPPTFPVYTPGGVWNHTDNLSGPSLKNPLMWLKERVDDYVTTSVAFNTKLTYNITNDLKFDVIFGADNRSVQEGIVWNQWVNQPTIASLTENKDFNWQNSNILTYHKIFADKHDLTLMAANEQSKTTTTSFGASGTDISPISVGYYNLGIANGQNVASNQLGFALQSFFGRLIYTYANKYYLTATYRADGSSKFQGKNKWGYFPSAALAWRLSEESFMKNQDIFSNLKLRGSWGVTGNQGVNPYATVATIGPMSNSYGLPNFYPGSIIIGSDNPDLKWESTEQIDAGIDISVLKGRISLTADYYIKNTRDMLYYQPIPYYNFGNYRNDPNGGAGVFVNVGEMENKGYEIVLSGTPVSNGKFRWDASFNISSYKNKILSLGVDTFALGSNNATAGLTGQSPFAMKVGEALGSFWGYEWLGVYKSSEATEAATYKFAPGDNKYRDLNNDHTIDGKDMKIIGNANPKFVWGLDNTFSYGNFALNISLQAVAGRKILNTVYGCATTLFGDATAITHVDGKDYWTPQNEDAKFANPASSTNKTFMESSQFLQDGSYVRVRNVALSYNLTKGLIKFSDLKLTVSAQNLLTFTKYKGYDPECNTVTGDFNGAIDAGAYPNARTITFSLQANF